jgi:hypothetical protein
MWLKSESEMFNLTHAQRVEAWQDGLHIYWPNGGKVVVPCPNSEEELKRIYNAMKRRSMAYELGRPGPRLVGQDWDE